MQKITFLTRVSEVMKGLVSYEDMMASLQRSCMRAEAENLRLMKTEEEEVDKLIQGLNSADRLHVPDKFMDVLVLRYLKNTQFLANIKEDDIDISGLEGELAYWKKTMLYEAPEMKSAPSGIISQERID